MIHPQVGSWYRRADGRLFEVVAVDEADGSVEIQHFDGTIGELDLEVWHELALEPAVAPEDITGAIDLDEEALAESSDACTAQWRDPLDLLDRLD